MRPVYSLGYEPFSELFGQPRGEGIEAESMTASGVSSIIGNARGGFKVRILRPRGHYRSFISSLGQRHYGQVLASDPQQSAVSQEK